MASLNFGMHLNYLLSVCFSSRAAISVQVINWEQRQAQAFVS